MTAPVPATHGRSEKRPPADAATRIEDLVKEGLTQLGVARALGTSPAVLRRWLKEDAALQEAYDSGGAKVEHELYNVLYQAAMKGNITAAIYLTKARFGWREGETPPSVATQVVINLPGAMSLDAYRGATIVPAVAVTATALPRAPRATTRKLQRG